MKELIFSKGMPEPLGAFVQGDTFNFALYTTTAKTLFLHIFANADDEIPITTYELDPYLNRTGNIWHIKIKGLQATRLLEVPRIYYLFAITDGQGVCKYVLEPYFRSITEEHIFKSEQLQAEKLKVQQTQCQKLNSKGFPKCVVHRQDYFDWEGDKHPNIPLSESIIYELHVKGISALATMPTKEKGTYKGLIRLIPYFKKLGITTIELLPVFETDEEEIDRVSPKDGRKLSNYWGYSPLSFFAPKCSYSTDKSNAIDEFKTMVKVMHKANIEVVLDVVFNHTAEGGNEGVSFSFKALSENEYYLLDENGRHQNYSGCGNTFNTSSEIGRKIVLDSLCYWVEVMHVDGFRFDLASIFMREKDSLNPHQSVINTNAKILQEISSHPSLKNIKLIAEPWDAGGAYNLGNFPIEWTEWSDKYRDLMRRFWLIQEEVPSIEQLLDILAGSLSIFSDKTLFPNFENERISSINFITCHDGFTMWDLVSYNQKHNEENGEENRDGSSNNLSYNHGVEGFTKDPKINKIRKQQMKNLLFSLLISNGCPMLLMGDEVMRSQKGNNNAYCQDNDISYFDWSLLDKNRELFDYVAFLIKIRKSLKLSNLFNASTLPKIICFNEVGNPVNRGEKHKFIAFFLKSENREESEYLIIFNASSYDVTFRLPKSSTSKKWQFLLDTSIEISQHSTSSKIEQSVYVSVSHSATLLFA